MLLKVEGGVVFTLSMCVSVCIPAQINTIFQCSILNIFLPIVFNIFFGTQKNRLI